MVSIQGKTKKQTVVDFLQANTGISFTVADIASETGVGKKAVTQIVFLLKREGKLKTTDASTKAHQYAWVG